MEKIIEINLYDKNDFTEKYNRKIVSKNLINYIIEEAIFTGKNDIIKVVINDECNFGYGCLEMINEGLEQEYLRSLRDHHLNNLKQFVLLVIGILFLFLSTVIKECFIFKEVFLIIGWVPIWEMIDIELFTDIKERRKRKILKRLLMSDFEIK